MRIVLLGAPGAGKGTQCKRIVERYNLLHLSSGDILRKERAEGSELGKQAQGYMDQGALVPDELIVEMMAKAIDDAPDSGYVLDGFPRTVNQAAELDKALKAKGQSIDAVVNLVIDDGVITRRLTGRRSCPQCGAVYHIENMPPKVDNKCDKDGVELVHRSDDTVEVFQNRLKTYHDQTKPVIGYYQKTSSVFDVDADKAVDQVSNLIFDKLDSLAKA